MLHRDIGAMSLWAFSCAQQGYVEANSSSEQAAPSMDDNRLADLGIEGF